MKVYIIADPANYWLAKKLLEKINDIEYSKYSIDYQFNSIDVFIAIIDAKFSNNKRLENEYSYCCKCIRSNQLFIPVVFENATIPSEISKFQCINCYNSKESISNTSSVIKDRLVDANYESMYSIIKKRNSDKKSSFIISLMLFLFSLISLILFIILNKLNYDIKTLPLSFFIVTLSTSLFYFWKYLVILILNKGESSLYSQNIDEIFSKRKTKKDDYDVSTSNLNALELMGLNLKEINEYYKWNKKQARSAFDLSVGLCIAGFVLIAASVILPIVFKDISSYAPIITAIGGAITELIAGTALIVYRNSVEQLNHYHKSLHEDQRILSSVNLLDRFSKDEQRDKMLYEILKSEIDMNIIDTKKPNEKPRILLKKKPKTK